MLVGYKDIRGENIYTMISQPHDVESMDNRARLAPEESWDAFQVGFRAGIRWEIDITRSQPATV
jgi:hypothetical protein